jgi:phosphatidylethanolamine/phosphatidyl-N-methylethanolamine N-methyltransferase
MYPEDQRFIRAAERKLFFKRWMQHPGRLGTWAPVSCGFAKAVANLLPHHGRVVEIGSGTGRTSRSILEKIPASHLTLIELDPELYAFLQTTLSGPHPELRIVHGDARQINQLIDPEWLGNVDCVFSAIPLMYLPLSEREAILQAAFSILKPGGFVLHLTYSATSPIASKPGIQSEKVLTFWKNFPPGFIFKYTQLSVG